MKPRLLIVSAVVIATALGIYQLRTPSTETLEAARQEATATSKHVAKPAVGSASTPFQTSTLANSQRSGPNQSLPAGFSWWRNSRLVVQVTRQS